jgi:transcriptional regulator with XRE-family HTH domain
MATFGYRLRTVRNLRKLTQETLALALSSEKSGQSRIGNYESTGPKARQPKLEEINHLAKALDVPTSVLTDQTAFDEFMASHAGRSSTDKISDPVEALIKRLQAFPEPVTPELLMKASALLEEIRNRKKGNVDAADTRRGRGTGSVIERKNGPGSNAKAKTSTGKPSKRKAS